VGGAGAAAAGDARRAGAGLPRAGDGLSQLSAQAFAELARVIADVEGALARAFAYDKINYLMLMMVDPDVHFHVVPRYAEARSFAGVDFADRGWPRLPELAGAPEPEAGVLRQIRDAVKQRWTSGAA
jgi:diadenosine tetraphosphate (Ap4A) HIT family hydrolase